MHVLRAFNAPEGLAEVEREPLSPEDQARLRRPDRGRLPRSEPGVSLHDRRRPGAALARRSGGDAGQHP